MLSDSDLDVTEGGQALQGRIDPTVEGNVAGSHDSSSMKRLGFFALFGFVESAVTCYIGIAIVRVGAIDLASHIPAESGANGDI